MLITAIIFIIKLLWRILVPAKTATKPKTNAPIVTSLYRTYNVTIKFHNGIAAGTAPNQGLLTTHARLFSEGVSNDLKYAKKVEGEVTEEAIEEFIKRCSSIFRADEHGIYIADFQIKAMLKDAAQRTKDTLKIKSLSKTLRDGGVIFPKKIYLGVAPSVEERPVKPESGPANIKIFQVAEGVTLKIPCAVLQNGDVTDDLFKKLWFVAQDVGLGANRHLGFGEFELVAFEAIGDWNPVNGSLARPIALAVDNKGVAVNGNGTAKE